MVSKNQQPRLPTTTLSVRELVVVLIAAMPAVVGYFAYDTRISVLESRNATFSEDHVYIQNVDDDIAALRTELAQVSMRLDMTASHLIKVQDLSRQLDKVSHTQRDRIEWATQELIIVKAEIRALDKAHH